MKKLMLALSIISIVPVHAENPLFFSCDRDTRIEKTSQSFMFTRPVYSNISARNSNFWHDFVYEKEGCLAGSLQAVALYQQSMAKRSAARYFLINHKSTLLVKGDAAPTFLDRDIRAEWLNLPSDFIGTFSVSPQQRQAGIWFEYNQNLVTFCDCPFLDALWVDIAVPFQWVENDIRISQTGIQNPGVSPHGIIEALNQQLWHFGKIGGKRSKTSIAEIHISIGTTFMDHDGFQIGAYSGVVIPTGRTQNPEFIFNPFIGHNNNWGFITGANFQFPLMCDCNCRYVSLYFDIENLFFLRNFQLRSLDLRFKPWSRYLILNTNDGLTNIPAINVLTQRVKVQSFNFVDLSAGFRFQSGMIEGEIGYNLWAHGDEEIRLRREFAPRWGIAGDGALVPGTYVSATASKSTIATLAPNDLDSNNHPTFVPIKESDLDLNSGAARATVAHRGHFAVGIRFGQETIQGLVGIGGFFEIPQENTGMKNWGVWFKIGASV